jgi:hypothetical protein
MAQKCSLERVRISRGSSCEEINHVRDSIKAKARQEAVQHVNQFMERYAF